MRLSKGPIAVCFLLLFVVVMSAVFSRATVKKQQSENPDFSNFPIVDLAAPSPAESKAKAIRDFKARKYSKKYGKAIGEETDQIFSTSDWDLRLPALPVQRSAAVIIGTVCRADAYLTPDKTGVYSEFAVKVDSILKEDPKKQLTGGDTITLERKGGRVRMPSGKIAVSWTNHQDMPKVGSRYVFFLTHDFEVAGDTYDDFYLLTGYELKDGKVFPLDKSPKQSVLDYKGTAESSFLTDLVEALKAPMPY
jgi:hypothetical protein